MAVKTTTILTPATLDGVTIEQDDTTKKIQVKDLGIKYDQLERDLQTVVSNGVQLIEVEETGFYVVDNDLNIGFATENPTCFGLGLANS